MCMMWEGVVSQGLVICVYVGVLVCSILGSSSGYGWWGLDSVVGTYSRVVMGVYDRCDVV